MKKDRFIAVLLIVILVLSSTVVLLPTSIGAATNVGLNWTDLGVVASNYFHAAVYLDNGIAIVGSLDDHVYRSTNYGLNWTDLGAIAASEIYIGTYFGNNTTTLGCQSGHVFRSVNAGANWTDLGDIAGSQMIFGMASTNNGTGVLGGLNKHIYRSTDYGGNWTDLGVVTVDTIDCIEYLENGIFVMGDRNGYIYRSSDYGSNWTNLGKITAGSGNDIDDIAYLENGIVIAGDDNDGGGHIFRSTDYGASWVDLGEITIHYIESVTYVRDGVAIAGDTFGEIYRSTDYGTTWTTPGEIGDLGSGMRAMECLSTDNATVDIVIVGNDAGHIYRTIDYIVVPTITTNDATYVSRSTARLNSYLDDDGGEYCDVRFQYSNVSGGGALEDFSGYVQVDPNGHINVVGLHHVDHAAYDNETAYIRDDKGAGNITAVFVHTLEVAAAKDDGGAHGYPWVVSNALNNIKALKTASATYLDVLLYDNGATVSITLQEGWGGNIFSDTYAGAWNTTYYLTITKNGTAYSGDIYSDSNRLNLLTTLNLTLHANHTFRYVFAGNTYNDGTAEHIDVDVDNLIMEGGGDWTNTTWINDTYATGDSPYVDVTNLTPNVTYYFRVQARNTLGVVTGAELNFTTYPTLEAPTDFTGYPDSTTISLAWTKGAGAANTMIREQVGAYPTNYTDGKQVYAGTMSTATDTGLSPGTTYYYRSWSFDVIGYSDNFTDFLMTTSAYSPTTNDTPTAPTTPSSWWGIPDYTNLQNIAGYAFVNQIADQYSIPYNTFWMSLILIIIMCIGLFIYSVQHNVTVALMLVGVMIVIASIAGLLPLWLIAAIGIPVAGIMLVKRRI